MSFFITISLCNRNLRIITCLIHLAGGKAKVLPLPGALFTVTRPPWAWAMCLTMARPNPVPPSLRLRPASTR